MFYNKLNKSQNSLNKTLKAIACIFMGGLSFFLIMSTMSEEETGWFDFLTSQKKYVQFVKQEKEETFPDNPDGTLNGLNLLLIGQLAEGYVKEYLTLAANNSKGELNNLETQIPLDLVLAASINESGYYPGTSLPVSYLPWDSSAKSPHWNKPYAGLPAEAMTLSKANKNVMNQPFLWANGPVTPYDKALTVGAPGQDNSVTPFQINIYKDKEIKPEWKSNMDGYGANGRSSPDLIFFPDQLTYLSTRYSVIDKYVDINDPDKKDIASFMFSWLYNPGPGNVRNDEMEGHGYKSVEGERRLKIIAADLEKVYEKYSSKIVDYSAPQQLSYHYLVVLPLVQDHGWKIKEDDKEDLLKHGMHAWEMISGNRDRSKFESFVNANTASFRMTNNSRNKRSGTSIQKKIEDMTIRSDSIAMGHAFTKGYVGKKVYARMLKHAGLDIDPNNPSDYMDTIPEGEWVPGSTGDFLKDEGIDPSKLSKERLAVLNKAYSKKGAPYIWGGHGEVFNDKNTYLRHIKAFGGDSTMIDADFEGRIKGKAGYDCSGFTRKSTLESINVEISRTTATQIGNKNLTTVSSSEAKPGDIVIFSKSNGETYHVGFFISHKDNKTLRLLHSPKTGRNVILEDYPINNKRSTYRTVNAYPD